MNIVAYPADFDGAGCYRCFYPLAQLAAHGGHKASIGLHTVIEETEKHKAVMWELDKFPGADLVVIQNPRLPEFRWFQEQVQKSGARVVIDIDDDYLNLPDYNPAKDSAPPQSRETFTWCLRHADAVTVTTPALKKSLSGVTSAPIYVLRNLLDWKVWKHVDPVYEKRDWDKFRVGYMGMALWHGGDVVEVLRPWLGRWLENHPDVEFVTIGDPQVHELIGVPHEQRVCVDSFAFRHQGIARYMATLDVGLVPLVRNKFNEAKSHLKGMEYAGVGVPCIATPTESYRDWWLAGGDAGPDGAGFLASRPKEWVRALDQLAADPELRTRMGRRARRLAEQNTVQDCWRLWENIYQEVLSADRAFPGVSVHRIGGYSKAA